MFCKFVCCMKWHLSPWRSGNLCESLTARTNWHVVLVYVFCLSLVFSLNMHPRTCLLWTCALLLFHLISPPLAMDRSKSKTPANMRLLNGFPPPFTFFSPPLSFVFLLLSLYFYCNLTGVQEDLCEKKLKVDEDASGLVPYAGDSSDEEEERTHSSKTDYS